MSLITSSPTNIYAQELLLVSWQLKSKNTQWRVRNIQDCKSKYMFWTALNYTQVGYAHCVLKWCKSIKYLILFIERCTLPAQVSYTLLSESLLYLWVWCVNVCEWFFFLWDRVAYVKTYIIIKSVFVNENKFF